VVRFQIERTHTLPFFHQVSSEFLPQSVIRTSLSALSAFLRSPNISNIYYLRLISIITIIVTDIISVFGYFTLKLKFLTISRLFLLGPFGRTSFFFLSRGSCPSTGIIFGFPVPSSSPPPSPLTGLILFVLSL